jgi:hypothetical protein
MKESMLYILAFKDGIRPTNYTVNNMSGFGD